MIYRYHENWGYGWGIGGSPEFGDDNFTESDSSGWGDGETGALDGDGIGYGRDGVGDGDDGSGTGDGSYYDDLDELMGEC